MIFLIMSGLMSYAQVNNQDALKRMTDSLKMAGLSDYAKKYPLLRQGIFATDYIGKGSIKAELNGKDLFEAQQRIIRFRSNFNIPIFKLGKNSITGTVSYQYQEYKITDINHFTSDFTDKNIDIKKSTIGFSASVNRTDSIFNRPVNFSASVLGITDELSSVKRINYTGSITVPIKRNQYTSLSAGVVVVIDPSSASPVFPIISYWHKYKASNLELFIDLPSRIALRKEFSKKTWATVGTQLTNNLAFFDLKQSTQPQNAIYTSLELRSGLNFEYLLTKKIIIGIEGGALSTVSSRMFERNDKQSDYFFKTSNKVVPYINLSISLLPFINRFK